MVIAPLVLARRPAGTVRPAVESAAPRPRGAGRCRRHRLFPDRPARRPGRLRRTPARARGARRAGRGQAARLPRRRSLRRVLPARRPHARSRRLRAGGGQGARREAVAAGTCRRLRHASPVASSTSSTTRSRPPPPSPRRRRPTSSRSTHSATTCCGSATARRRGRGSSRRSATATLEHRLLCSQLPAGPRRKRDRSGRTHDRELQRVEDPRAAAPHRRRPGARLGGAGYRDDQALAARARAGTSSRCSTTRRCRSRCSTTVR